MSLSVLYDGSYTFPCAPRYGRELGLPGLSENCFMRSNQTARCDECAFIQTRMNSSRCLLSLCEHALFCMLWRAFLSQCQKSGNSPTPSPNKEGLFIHRMNDGSFQALENVSTPALAR
jgi:hypothetical protein